MSHDASGTPPTEAGIAGRATRAERIAIEQHSVSGLFWVMGWLFSIGFLQLPFWQGALAILIWPYYLGAALAGLLR